MLLAVEGGGFFSSSASGYSKGLALLLLGQKDEEKPMRVTPWHHYQLVDQEKNNSNIPLASAKNRSIHGCASFDCFGSVTAGVESPSSPLKVGPTILHSIKKDEDESIGDENSIKRISIKSSLKKEKKSNQEHENGKRKVNWTDMSGGELVEIREFESSDYGDSDDEFEDGKEKTCSCSIM